MMTIGSLRDVLGAMFAVIGTGLVGMGIGLILFGLDRVSLDLPSPSHDALAVGTVIVMLGAAALGVATEGGLRSFRSSDAAQPWERAVSWVPALLIGLWVVGWLARLSESLLLRFSDLLVLVPNYLVQVRDRGWVAGLIALAAIWLTLQYGSTRFRWLGDNLAFFLYTPWMGLVLLTYQPG